MEAGSCDSSLGDSQKLKKKVIEMEKVVWERSEEGDEQEFWERCTQWQCQWNSSFPEID